MPPDWARAHGASDRVLLMLSPGWFPRYQTLHLLLSRLGKPVPQVVMKLLGAVGKPSASTSNEKKKGNTGYLYLNSGLLPTEYPGTTFCVSLYQLLRHSQKVSFFPTITKNNYKYSIKYKWQAQITPFYRHSSSPQEWPPPGKELREWTPTSKGPLVPKLALLEDQLRVNLESQVLCLGAIPHPWDMN